MIDRLTILFSIILVFLILTGIEGQINTAIAGETVWFEDWDEVMETAKRNSKPVIVDFIAPACPGCNKLNKETLSAPEIVQRFKEDWVCIRIHILYKNKQGTYNGDTINYFKIPEYFGIKGLPTLLFFDKNQKHVYSLAGFI
ncbi:MAG TPA: thioredoxin family protein, partial [Anaerolineae bacterium]|nr:thioredoxin family protein [Anaerolineae bacterium]